MTSKSPGFTLLSSPIGWIGVVAVNEALVDVLIDEQPIALSTAIDRRHPGALTGSGGVLSAATVQLQEYFLGRRHHFDLSLDLSGRTLFTLAILQALAQVPYGETLTYGELAARAGYAGCARAVGRVMAANRFPLLLPCHRILGAGGRLTGYSGGSGLKTKEWLLDFEKTQLLKNI